MRQFKDYLWGKIRIGILLSWVSLFVIFVMIYASLVLLEKEQQLASSLQVAAYTVRASMDAGEWPLALGHLTKMQEKGPVFNIELSNKNKTDLAGPFGQVPFGFGRVCRIESVAEGVSLKGCMVVFGMGEFVTLGLLILLGLIIYVLMYKIFGSNMYSMIEKISNSLRSIGEADTPTVKNKDEIAEIRSINEYVSSLVQQAREASKVKAIGELSLQVAHDVRSPLTALDMAVKDTHSLPEEKRLLIRNAVNRIHDIANNLLKYHRHGCTTDVADIHKKSMIIAILDTIVSEKRSQYHGRAIKFELFADDHARLVFSILEHVEFKRMISNLIDNAVEAIHHVNGVVKIALKYVDEQAYIHIEDNGIGIPDHLLNDILSNRLSCDKLHGNGLGLPHAYALISRLGGSIRLSSTVHVGTKIEIQLPAAKAPDWFMDKVKIRNNSTIVILDDDPSIHQVWKNRFNTFTNGDNNIRLVDFYSIASLAEWLSQNTANLSKYVFLVDYEILGSETNGVQIINDFGIQCKSVLVTSRYEEAEVIKECERNNIKILPKSVAAYVPIIVYNQKVYDAILIDDDVLIRESWIQSATCHRKSIRVFSSPSEFFSSHDEFSHECPIYIDSRLEDNQLGEIVAEEIYQLGYKTIHLVTGLPAEKFQSFTYISSIIGKLPIWELCSGNQS